jgi:O-antigen/teichoic acid export membrane protein
MAAMFMIVRKSYIPVIDVAKLKDLLAFALPTLPHVLSGTIWRFADRFFLVGMATLAVTGVYSLAQTIASVVLMAVGGMTTALNPLFFRRANAGDTNLPADWAHLCSLFAATTAYLALGMALLGPALLNCLTPARYHTAGPLLPVLTLGQVFIGFGWLATPAMGYTRKTWIYPIGSFTALALNSLLSVLLVPRWGATGAAWAMVASAGLQAVLLVIASYHFYPVPYERSKLLLIAGLACAAYALGSWPWPGVPAGLPEIATCLIFPAAILACGVITPDERAALLAQLPFLRPRKP